MSSEACVCVCVDERTAKQHRHEIRVYVQTIGVHVVTESAHTCKKPLLRLRETLFVCILYLNVLGGFFAVFCLSMHQFDFKWFWRGKWGLSCGCKAEASCNNTFHQHDASMKAFNYSCAKHAAG